MTTFYANVGGPLVVDATDPEHARRYIAERLGYENKPWLVRDLEITPATDEQIERYLAVADKVNVPRAPVYRDRTKRDT